MSYSFRNRPKLSDRYRGKSGDEILNELKNQIDEDRKMFFESSPGWNSVQSPGSFSRAGHPLDDMMSRGRQDIRSHLDDLAQRHPEFADHLRCPPWGGEMGSTSRGTWGRKRRGSGSSGDDIAGQESSSQGPQQSEEASPSRGRSRQNNLPQYGLRNTVDLGQQQQCEDQEKGRGQRSWSAPPDNRTQNPPDPPRFVSRLDIPVNAMPNNPGSDQGKPPVAPKQQPQQQQQQPPPQPQPHNVPQQSQQNAPSKQSQQSSNVRHIPIFVEGRDEPLLPKATTDAPTERIFTERVPPHPSTFSYGRPSQFTPRQSQQQSTPQMSQQTAYTQQAAPPKAKTFAQQQQVPPQPPPPPPPPQQQQQKQEGGQHQEQAQPKTTSQPPKQPLPNDPIYHVQAIQKDVDELKLKVDTFSGNSRKDKDYMYLDEMLTRNLLKLDNIETDGKEDVRQARKAVIRNIQQCISILESRVPSPDEVCQNSSEVEKSNDPSGEQSSDKPQPGSGLVKTEAVVEVSAVPAESQDNSGLKMEVKNLAEAEVNKMKPEVAVNKSQSEHAMEIESVANVEKGSGEQVKLEPNSQGGTNVQTMDLSQAPSEKSENVLNVDGECNTQHTKMQVDDNAVNVDSSSKETVPDTLGKDAGDDKATGLSPAGDGGPNKAPKAKSPKKGKRAT